MAMKVLFDPASGKILGAQIVGHEGVDNRINVLATAIQAGMTVFDLEEAELAYAPQFGSAKDPINMVGFVASNLARGDYAQIHVDDWESGQAGSGVLIDVRTAKEYAAGRIPSAINIPLEELRGRLDELPRHGRVVVHCQVGMRGYMATLLLRQAGFDALNLAGGYKTYLLFHPEGDH
jgi:rhodanese-related sulfurtransferase